VFSWQAQILLGVQPLIARLPLLSSFVPEACFGRIDRRAQGCGLDGRPKVFAFEPVLGMKLLYLRRIVAWIQNL
jgi:hypothetical protein